MAFRFKWARSCLVTAAACVLVCAAVVPAAAEGTVKRVYTRVFTGEGFDTCHAPSVKTMAAWWKSSPYRAIGIDLAHVSLPGVARPDALWIARWDNKSTVEDPSVPSGAWTPHQRIKQFTGGHKESHGGVTINIDRDWIDGPVARIG